MTLARLFTLPYFFLLAVGLMVPSDAQHGLFSLKSLSFLGALGAVGAYALLRQKINLAQFKLLSFAACSLAVLFFWLLISLARDQTTSTAQFDQFKLFLITLAVPLTSLYIVKEGLVTPQQIFKTALYASFAYAFAKVLLVSLHLLHIVNAWTLIDALGIRYMRMGIYGGLDRFQTSVDIATPFLLFFLLQAEHLGLTFKKPFRATYITISLLSTFLSFSRYLIFMYLASTLLYWLTLDPKRFLKTSFFLLLFSFAAFFAIGPEKVEKIIERRVFSKNSFHSDNTRVKQANALLTEYEEAPFLGKGLGGYVPSHIRDSLLLHSYEVQWLAFLMQFGLLGLLLLLTPLFFIAWRLIAAPISRLRLSFLGAFLPLPFLRLYQPLPHLPDKWHHLYPLLHSMNVFTRNRAWSMIVNHA